MGVAHIKVYAVPRRVEVLTRDGEAFSFADGAWVSQAPSASLLREVQTLLRSVPKPPRKPRKPKPKG